MIKRKEITSYNIPILFIIFKRKDTALQVVDAIAKIKPKKLYISQDGPKNRKEEKDVLETRKAVLSRINWDCELTVWVHKKNLGLRGHIPQAFDKFFKKEECGIYLEDDTLPSEDFFYFEQQLLEKYKNNQKIFSINGTNFYPERVKPKYSYYLSKIGDIWGFGLWRRSWKLYNGNLKDFSNLSKSLKYNSYFFSYKYKFYLESFWKAIFKRKLDSWAMQMVFAAVKNNMYFIAPKVNMVNNIGVANRASNLSLQLYFKKYGNPFPIKHPKKLIYNDEYDISYFRHMLRGGWLRVGLISIYLNFSPNVRKTINSVIALVLNLFRRNG